MDRSFSEKTKVTEIFSYTWRIKNFSNIPKNKVYTSPDFKVKGIPLHLELYTTQESCNGSKDYYTYFYINGIPESCKKVRFNVVLRNSDCKVLYCDEKEFDCNSSAHKTTYSIAKQALLKDKKSHLPDDILDVYCEVSMAIDDEMSVDSAMEDMANSIDSQAPARKVHEFSSFFQSAHCSDVKLVVDGKEIFAHKVILSNMSSVFASMFKGDSKEKEDNVVTIGEVNYDIFTEALRYIYYGKVENLGEIANDLLAIADKYDILNLKELCMTSIFKEITPDNAPFVYEKARVYNMEKLKKQAFQTIANRFYEVPASELESLPDSYKDVLVNIFLRSRAKV